MGDLTIENLTIHLHVHAGPTDGGDALRALTTTITQGMDTIMSTLDEALAAVRQNNDLTDSLIQAFGVVVAELREHADDPEKIRAILDEVEAQNEETAAAILANTPADPVAPVDPAEDPLPGDSTGSGGDGGGGDVATPTTPSEDAAAAGAAQPDVSGDQSVSPTQLPDGADAVQPADGTDGGGVPA